jgi:NAD(P)-dependent dehydrogenase (short-subunit alcohol dehydrogenase family)
MADYFHNRTALITGAARGIGLATAELLGRRGAKVVVTDVSGEGLLAAEARLAAAGIETLALPADVSSPEDCRAVAQKTLERFGRLDILVNNAGISMVARFDECAAEPCRKLLEVNLLGSVYMSLAALPALKSARGHLVFVASVSGIRAIPYGSLYSASKAALRNLAESLRLELAPDGVHVGCICPGFTSSDPAKTVMRGDGSPRPIARPPHDTPEGVARGIARLIERRRRELVLTPLGKLTAVLQRLSPALLDRLLAGRELKN